MKKKLSTRVRRVVSAPKAAQIAPIPKLKQKPRGAPFKPGNRFGIASRFKPNNNANPQGRPSLKRLNAACVDVLARIVPREELAAAGLPISLFGKTYAEIGAWVLQQEGLRGNISAIAEVGDRAEGRPGVASPDNGEQSPFAMLILSMDQRSDVIGPAERRQLQEGEDGSSN